MKRPTLVISSLCALIIFVLSVDATQKNDERAQAQQIMEKMREAIFGSLPVENIKGLSLTWKYRVYFRLAGVQNTGETNIDLKFPDKMVIRDVMDLSSTGGQRTSYRVLSGAESGMDSRSSSGESLITRNPEDDDPIKRLHKIRESQVLQLIWMALPSSPDFPLTFLYAGEARASDGQAHIIDIKGPDEFSARLFIDKTTFHLLMMTFTAQGPTTINLASRDMRGEKGGIPKNIPSRKTEIKNRYSKYKQMNGVTLPHLITQEQNGQIVKESELSSFRLNPEFAPDYFDPRKKRK